MGAFVLFVHTITAAARDGPPPENLQSPLHQQQQQQQQPPQPPQQPQPQHRLSAKLMPDLIALLQPGGGLKGPPESLLALMEEDGTIRRPPSKVDNPDGTSAALPRHLIQADGSLAGPPLDLLRRTADMYHGMEKHKDALDRARSFSPEAVQVRGARTPPSRRTVVSRACGDRHPARASACGMPNCLKCYDATRTTGAGEHRGWLHESALGLSSRVRPWGGPRTARLRLPEKVFGRAAANVRRRVRGHVLWSMSTGYIDSSCSQDVAR